MELTWIQFLLRTIPETFIMIWGIYVISREKINFKRYIILAIINSLTIFLIRKLPIIFGVHTIINIFAIIAICSIFGMPVIKAIYSTLLVFILLIIGEILNMTLLNYMNININSEARGSFMQIFYQLPSLIILLSGITIIYYILNKKTIKDVFKSKNSL